MDEKTNKTFVMTEIDSLDFDDLVTAIKRTAISQKIKFDMPINQSTVMQAVIRTMIARDAKTLDEQKKAQTENIAKILTTLGTMSQEIRAAIEAVSDKAGQVDTKAGSEASGIKPAQQG